MMVQEMKVEVGQYSLYQVKPSACSASEQGPKSEYCELFPAMQEPGCSPCLKQNPHMSALSRVKHSYWSGS